MLRRAIEHPPGAQIDAVELPDGSWHRPAVRRWARLVSPALLRRQMRTVVSIEPGARAWAWRAGPHRADVVISNTDEDYYLAHELGHVIEFGDDDVFREAATWLARQNGRVIGARVGDLPDADGPYATGVGRWDADSWESDLDRYAGRLYDPTHAGPRTLEVAGRQIPYTEVVSVGMERLMRDPLAFARENWEYFSFLVRRVTHR